MGFTEVFGGNTIYPADVSYLALALTGDIEFDWPVESAAPPYPLARIIDVMTNGGHTMRLPDATMASPGETALFNILTASTATCFLVDHDGVNVGVLAPGEQWEIYLTDNTTQAGQWEIFHFGASTATVQPSALAGYGIVVTGSTLSQSVPVVTFDASPKAVGPADRASALVWTGPGTGVLNLPGVSAVGNNFFFSARNAGGGMLTLDPLGTEQIDGGSIVGLSPGEGVVLVTDGVVWYTLGRGQAAVFAFDYTAIDVSPGGTYTLVGSELNRIAYRFTGVLTTDVTIIVPSTVQQYWVDNSTTGPFGLGISTAGGTPVAVPQGARAILYCDGTNVIDAETGGISTPVNASDGGTGHSSYVIGDMLTASSPFTLARLPAAPVGNALIAKGAGVMPEWGDVDLTNSVTGVLPPANGGTGSAAAAFIPDYHIRGGPVGQLQSSAILKDDGVYLTAVFGGEDRYIFNNDSFTTHGATVGIGYTAASGGPGTGPSLSFWNKDFSVKYGYVSHDGANMLMTNELTGNLKFNTATQAFQVNGVGGGFIGPMAAGTYFEFFGVGEMMHLRTASAMGDCYLSWSSPSGRKGYLGYGSTTDDSLALINQMGAPMYFGNGGVIQMMLTNVGQLGIGTITPSSQLHVNSALNERVLASVGNPSGLARIGTDATGVSEIRFYEPKSLRIGSDNLAGGIADYLTIANGGNVGVGTNTPASKFQVNGNLRVANPGEPDTYHVNIVPVSPFAGSVNWEFQTTDATGGFRKPMIFNSASGNVVFPYNVSVGTQPYPWQAFSAIDISGGAVGTFTPVSRNIGLFANVWFNGSSYIYKQDGAASYYNIGNSGENAWFVAASGVAGNVAVLNQKMILSPDGRLGVGTPTGNTPTDKLHVYGGNIVVESATNVDGYFRAKNTVADWYMGMLGAAPWSRWSLYNNLNGYECVTVTQPGRFGIGTATPEGHFHCIGQGIFGPVTGGDDVGGITIQCGAGRAAALNFKEAATTKGSMFFYAPGQNTYMDMDVIVVRTLAGSTRLYMAGDGFYPGVPSTYTCGRSDLSWSAVYAANGTIQPSDERKKNWLGGLSAAELAAAKAIAQGIGKFRWLDDALGADTHVGVRAQVVVAAMEAQGLDALSYGFVHYDEWDETPALPATPRVEEVTDELGNVTTPFDPGFSGDPGRPAGNIYSVAYAELGMFIAAAQEQRLAALEALL